MSDQTDTSPYASYDRLRNFLLLVAVGVVAAGFFYFRARSDARLRQLGLADPEAKKHLVTDSMNELAKEHQDRPAPPIKLLDSEGLPLELSKLVADRPAVIYFIKDGCPCSETYEPFIQELARNYADVVSIVGVIDGDQATAQAWSSRFVDPYPIAFDPTSDTMARWGATNSAFTGLVDRGGNLVAYWPGYSRWMLEELSQKISELTNVPRRRLALLDAPSKLYTGCSFGTEDPSQIERR